MDQVIQSIIKKLEQVKTQETDVRKIRQLTICIGQLQKIGQPGKFDKVRFWAILDKLLPWIIIGEKCFKDIIHLWTSDR